MEPAEPRRFEWIGGPGEREFAAQISYGIPDVLGGARAKFAGKCVVVVGSGHSAINVVLDLLSLGEQVKGTDITWVMRKENLNLVWGGGSADALEARGLPGTRAKQAVEAGRLRVLSPYRHRSVAGVHDGALGPPIDPNEHSYGTLRPHGAKELAHPEKDFFIIGMKSYGRAPTFLMATGYEQARSVAAMLSGDLDAAARVELELPETGVCSTTVTLDGAAGCCGGPAAEGVDGCCVRDADAKAAGEAGCGCGTKAPPQLLPIGGTPRR